MGLNKLAICIVFLSPTVILGQQYNSDGEYFSNVVQKAMEDIAVKLYQVKESNFLEVPTYNHFDLKETTTLEHYWEAKRDYEFVKSIPDVHFPDDSLALIDTTILKRFSKSMIKGLSFGYEKEFDPFGSQSVKKLIAVAPNRETMNWDQNIITEPMFWFGLETLKEYLNPNELKLLMFLSKLGFNESDMGWSEQYVYSSLDTIKSTKLDDAVFIEFEKGFKAHYKNSLKPRGFSGYYLDSLFKEPIDSLDLNPTCESYDTFDFGVFYSLNELDYFNNYSVYYSGNWFRVKSIKWQIIGNECSSVMNAFPTIFCRSEDVMYLLPEWLQFLIKESPELLNQDN